MKVRIWRCPRSRLWYCTRLDIPESWLNPVAFACNAFLAYQRYKELLS
jgi:hypothetical protein